MSTLTRAIEIAADAHHGQVDKTGQPYILHPLRVMLAQNDEARIVGVLHDLLEDTNWSVAKLQIEGFSQDIVEAVRALTRLEGETYEQFVLRAKRNELARVVKIADINDNLRPGAEHLAGRYRAALGILEAAA